MSFNSASNNSEDMQLVAYGAGQAGVPAIPGGPGTEENPIAVENAPETRVVRWQGRNPATSYYGAAAEGNEDYEPDQEEEEEEEEIEEDEAEEEEVEEEAEDAVDQRNIVAGGRARHPPALEFKAPPLPLAGAPAAPIVAPLPAPGAGGAIVLQFPAGMSSANLPILSVKPEDWNKVQAFVQALGASQDLSRQVIAVPVAYIPEIVDLDFETPENPKDTAADKYYVEMMAGHQEYKTLGIKKLAIERKMAKALVKVGVAKNKHRRVEAAIQTNRAARAHRQDLAAQARRAAKAEKLARLRHE